MMKIKKLNILKILIAALAIVCLSGQAFASGASPTANDDMADAVNEGGTVTTADTGQTSVLHDDTDPESDPLTVNSVNGNGADVGVPTLITNGTVTLNADGTFSYTHNGSENFADSFTYTVYDGTNTSNTATVTIAITAVNDNTPVANDDVADAVDEGAAVTTVDGGQASLLHDDTDLDLPNDTLTVNTTPVTPPSHGALTLNADGTFSYTHDGSENFSDSFTYEVSDATAHTDTATVTIAITAVNDNTPVANDDVADAVDEGAAVTTVDGGQASLLHDDTDLDLPNDTLTVNTTPVTPPSHGALTLNADGTFSYTHDGSENFSDSFTYEVSDATAHTDTATVTIAITAVNDNTPVANDDVADAVDEGAAVTTVDGGQASLLHDDTDLDLPNDTLTVNTTPVTPPSHGALTLNADGTFSYTHDGSENFSDSFTYEVSDATAHTDTATVTIAITAVNDNTPVANDDVADAVDEGAAVTTVDGGQASLLHDDTDLDLPNDTLTVNTTPVTPPSHGALTLNADGTFSYTHDGSENFSDSFTYEVSDATAHTDTATVTIAITAVNDNTPVANDDVADAVDEGAAVTTVDGGQASLLHDDTDLDLPNDTLTVNTTPVTPPSHGALTLNADGTFSYTHDGSENFSDSFTYEVSDATAHTDTATVTIAITAVNDNTPVANDDVADAVDEGAAVTTVDGGQASLLHDDTDLDLPNDTLTVNTTPVTPPSHGALTLNADGTFSYTHDGSENFSDSFTYEVSDATAHTDTATVTIAITAVNEAPTDISLDNSSVDENSAVGTLVGNLSTTDVDTGDTHTYSIQTAGVPFQINGNNLEVGGALDFETQNSYNITIRTTDSGGLWYEEPFTITVNDVNEAPDAVDDTGSTDEDTVLSVAVGSGGVLDNDSDVDAGDTFSVTSYDATSTNGASVAVNADGSYSYDPTVSPTLQALMAGDSVNDTFTYTITDSQTATDTATATITVTGVNDAPTDIALDNSSIDENSAVGTLVGNLSTADVDTGDTHIYSIQTAGVPFQINGNRLEVGGVLDFETQNSYNITIRTTDSGGLWYEEPFTITIIDVNEAPAADFSGTPLTIVQGEMVTFTDSSTDPENNIVGWSWDFDNDGTEDSIAQNPTHIYNVPGTYTVSLTVTDADSAMDTETKIGYIWVKALYDLTITWDGTGAGDVMAGAGSPGYPGGTSHGSAGNSVVYTFVEGDSIGLSAVGDLPPPGAGSLFKGFSGDATGMTPTISMNGDKAVTAEFAQRWEITTNNPSNGTISPSGFGSPVIVEQGSDQKFIFDPNTCYEVDNVVVDGSSIGGEIREYTFSYVTEDHSIDVEFYHYDCTITATAENGGTITPSGALTVPCGSIQSFTILAGMGNEIAEVLVDGVSLLIGSGITTYNYNWINVKKDDDDTSPCVHYIVAKFTRPAVSCMDISDVPLNTLINSAPANIVFVLDDSGSMDWEFMTTDDNGKFETKTANIEYIFDIADNLYKTGVNSQVLSGDDRKLWKSQWVGINKIYYDPSVEYEPWATFGNAPLNNPWSQPVYDSVGDPALNLSGTYVSIDAGIVVDNLDGAPYFTTTGAWSESDLTPEHDGSSEQTTNSGDTATFTPNIPTAGNYDVYAWWNCYNDRDQNAEITIVDSAGTHTVNRDQRSGGAHGCGQWVPLGTYNFASGTSGSVTIARHAGSTGSSTVADAVKFVTSGLSIDVKNAHYYVWSASRGKPYLVIIDGGNIDYYAVDAIDSDDMIEDEGLTIIGSPPDDVIPKNESGTPRTYTEERQNFANWFSYYRRRDLVTRMAVGKVITEMSGVNIGLRGINGVLIQPVLKVRVGGEDNTNTLLNGLYSYRLDGSRASTPLRRGLEFVGQYFDKDDGEDGGVGTSPIASAEEGGECQQNFAVVFTDGYYNGLAPVGCGNADGDNGPPYADGFSKNLADVAMYYYENDLADSLDNLVPANPFDDATHQHLVTYGVTFGVYGTLNPDDYDLENCVDGTEPDCPQWPGPITASGDKRFKIDDLWHAAVNGRGLFLSASNPQELVAAFMAVMDNIVLRIGSASSVSVNGDELYTKLSGNILMYQSNYDSDGWIGDVKAYRVCTDLTGDCAGKEIGDVITSSYVWSANEKLGGLNWNTGRKIVTYNGTDSGKPFRWGDLTADQQTALNNDSTLLDYLRGDTNNEEANGGTFRDRFGRLGDIVHSSPVFENGVLYAGGNDGMLHAFAAADDEPYTGTVGGRELFAYVPNLVFNNLSQIADPAYTHKYFVDLTPTVKAGVDISGVSTTVLVGGLGKGGRGYYALDVTDPASWTSEGAIDGKVLWEYPKATVTDDDMGYSYSKPAIVKSMDSSVGSNGWIVIFGNGYNSQNGHAVLYILNPQTGDIIKKIDTGVGGCNGLSTPVPIDVDYDDMVDYVYAGDLRGNMWKFDLTGSDSNNWEVAFDDVTDDQPLFQAQGPGGTTQPITAKPDVMYHPKEHGYMVVFATGQFLGESDFADTTVQAFYGIWDYGDDEDDSEYLGFFNRGFAHELSNQPSTVTLLAQQVIPSESPDPNAPDFWTVTLTDGAGNPYDLLLRLTTNNEIVWETMDDPDANQNPPEFLPDLSNTNDNHAGWYFDLPLNGERGTVDVMVRNGNAIAISYRPDDVPCACGGDSVIHEFSAESGARLTRPQFDINGDGVIDENDMINIGTDENPIWVVPTGIQMPGQVQPPAILIDPDTGVEIKYLSSSSGTIEMVKEKAANVGITHWREFE